MSRRNWSFGRWTCLLAIAWLTATTVISCGGAGDQSVFNGDSGVDGTGNGPGNDSSTGGNHDGPSLVGDDSSGGDGNGGCHPAKMCPTGQNCGQALDGCGGVINCGANGGTACANPNEGCGCGGKNPPRCGLCAGGGDGGDAGNTCVPKTACASGENCGYEADGCGGVINCGPADGGPACPPDEYCGGGGFNQCGGSKGLNPDGSVPCTPLTHCTNGQNCGVQGDGCGGVVMCGGCNPPEYCGGGGFNICGGNSGLGPDGAPNCTPTTCQKLGFDCGWAGDGCGGALQCGSCQAPQICGGGGIPSVCGNSQCTGLCQQQVTCDGGTQTTITGKVIAGTIPMFGTPDPVPNVLVYVANSPIQPFPPGVQCSQCGSNVSGNPLVQTTTAFDGTFTLTNVPATNVPPNNPLHLVIQLGYWRREFYFNNVPACQTTNIGNLQMPQTQAQGDIPLTAISTGSVDSLECVLLKMGIDQSEFTINTGGGRVHIYEGNGSSLGAATTPAETALMGNGGTFMNYDQILFPCWGYRATKTNAELANLVTYANGGGHFFATHYSYSWEFQNPPFNTVVNWNVDYNATNGPDPYSVQLPPTNPKGTIFSDWLHLVGAMPNPQTVDINYERHDVNSVTAKSVDWISGNDPSDGTAQVVHFTFDTPVGAQTQCGHAIFSDFHVANAATSSSTIFPAECMKNETTGVTCSNAAPCPMTAQEKILEYMIWDLSSCVGPSTPPTCKPETCQDQNINCGPAGDGCGNELMCGTCTPPATCGGGGVPGQCGAPEGGSCNPMTCQQQNINCGPAGDGCGNEIMCGTCTPPQTCGGGGTAGQCGYPDAGMCKPVSCSQQNIFCGPAGDGCGNEIMCGTCTPPQTCGGGGTPGQCGSPDAGSCLPTSCMQQGIECGMAQDGCGNVLNCGTCAQGQTCGGAGCTPGHCCNTNQ